MTKRAKPVKAKDNRYKPCSECIHGLYDETKEFDDIDGVLHCTWCGKEVKRYT